MNTSILDQPADETADFLASLSPEIIQDCKAINNTLQAIGKVKAHFATHYANAAIDSYGVMGIVREVLTEADAVFARSKNGWIEDTDLRDIAIAVSLTTDQIIERAKPKFNDAGMRYEPQAIKNVLSTYGKKEIRPGRKMGHVTFIS